MREEVRQRGGEGMGESEVFRIRYVGMLWFIRGRLDVGKATTL